MRTMTVPRVQYRQFDIAIGDPVVIGKRQDGTDERVYPLTFSSEQPVRRWSWTEPYEYDEILSHAPGDVDLSVAKDGLPFLKVHQTLLHCGSVEDIKLLEKEKKLAGSARFSSIPLGQEMETMVREGHTKRVSVGYEILGLTLVSTDKKTAIPTYRASWMPLESSSAPVPADQTVGFGRMRPGTAEWEESRSKAKNVEMIELAIEERAADPPREGDGIMGRTIVPGVTPELPPLGGAPAEPEKRSDRDGEIAEIMKMSEAHGMIDRAGGWIGEHLTKAQVSERILELIRTKGNGQPPAETVDGLSARDRKNYSYARALGMVVERFDGQRKSFDGLEGEVHQELLRTSMTGASHNGLLIPWRVRRSPEELAIRAMTTTDPTGGAAVVGTMYMPDLIDMLRPQTLVLTMGGRLLTGLRGAVQFTKKTAASTVYWMDEKPAAGATASEVGYGYLSMNGKILIGTTEFSRALAINAFRDVEQDVMNDLVQGVGLAIDLAWFHGKGTDKQPMGVYSTPDVLAEAFGGVATRAHVRKMIAKVADENATLGKLGFATTPLAANDCGETPLMPGDSPFPRFLWEGPLNKGVMEGFPALSSTQISKTLGTGAEHGLIFGNWNDALIGIWGNDVEIIVDQITKASEGQIVITSFSSADCAVRRPQSFCKATGLTVAA